MGGVKMNRENLRIVATMLEVYGFEVHDLGRPDVAAAMDSDGNGTEV
jgi:hypothetical protein